MSTAIYSHHFPYLMHHLVSDMASEGYLSAVCLYGTVSAVILFGENYLAK